MDDISWCMFLHFTCTWLNFIPHCSIFQNNDLCWFILCHFVTCSSHELDLNRVVLRLLTRAIKYAVQKEDSLLQDQSEIGDTSTDLSSETFSRICQLGGQVYPASINWNVLEHHLVSAHNELVSVNGVSQQHSFTYSMHSEVSVLYSLSAAKIHLGMALCLVLCPPPVDPVALDNAHYHCINQLVSSPLLLMTGVVRNKCVTCISLPSP